MITRSCDKKVRYAYNFIWRYSNDNDIEPVSDQKFRYAKIGQYTVDDVLIKVYDTLADAADAMGKSRRNTSALSACYFGKAENAHGYKWKPIL